MFSSALIMLPLIMVGTETAWVIFVKELSIKKPLFSEFRMLKK